VKYLVDANVLIEAKNRYYAFDIAPGFWKWLDQAHAQGTVFSRVKIPDACRGLEVHWVNTFEMLRSTGVTLGLPGAAHQVEERNIESASHKCIHPVRNAAQSHSPSPRITHHDDSDISRAHQRPQRSSTPGARPGCPGSWRGLGGHERRRSGTTPQLRR